jgi:hypothetical protein
MFTLKIETDNAAFEDGSFEVARILREVAKRLDRGETDGRVQDVNGHTVGDFGFSTLLTGRGGSQ